MVRPDGTKSAEVISVIKTVAKRGLGTKEDTVREVTQYWDFDGNFLAEMDTEFCIPVIVYEAEAIRKSAEHNKKIQTKDLVQCAYCKKIIVRTDRYCQYCGNSTETESS